MAWRHIDDLDVGATDPARFDLDEHLADPSLGSRDVSYDQSTVSLEDGRSHQGGVMRAPRRAAGGRPTSATDPAPGRRCRR